MNRITVRRATDPVDWVPIEGDVPPVGEEVVDFKSGDGRFAVGLWRRDPEEGPMVLSEYHEVMYILEGRVEITEDDGTVHQVGPGDLVVAPLGATARWRAIEPVRKVWAIYRE